MIRAIPPAGPPARGPRTAGPLVQFHLPRPAGEEEAPFEFSTWKIQHVTHTLARGLIRVANAVARGAVDRQVIEMARRIADEIKVRQLARQREMRRQWMRKVRAERRAA